MDKRVLDQICSEIQAYIDEECSQDYELRMCCAPDFVKSSLSDVLEELEETFSQSLLRLIDECGLSDANVYKKAMVDRRLFSKIKKDVYYHPSKVTAIAFSLALELSLDECLDLLNRAGYTLSYSDKFDLIVRYCFEHGIYDINDVNELLNRFGQTLIGVKKN